MPKPLIEYRQHEPFSIQVELVEGCSLACSFCGINGIRTKPGNLKSADLGMLSRLAKEIKRVGWKPRIEFAMHGEPSLHPQVVECIQIFREQLPKTSLMLTSNGSGFVGPRIANIEKLFEAGLNCLALDKYDGVNFVTKVEEGLKGYPKISVKQYPADKTATVHKRHKPGTQVVVIIADLLSAKTGNHSLLANHAGQAAPPDYSKINSRCTYPFRELSIRWDGNVALCCDDFRGVYKIANILDMSLDVLWQHPRFQAARRKLYHRERDFGPCHGCTAISYRVGFLPDPSGQDTLPFPDEDDALIISQAIAGNSFTLPVLRDWEV